MAMKGIRVLEMAGLAPSPYCGMILSDFGADVIRVDRTAAAGMDTLCRGKRSVAINLKNPDGIKTIKKLAMQSDVLIEPFRRGVMEKLGIGPKVLMKENPRLIYARLTGYGQEGPLSDRAGHDINYLSISGTLSAMGRKGTKPYAPINFLADFAGGGLMCALGITMALYERNKSGQGQVIDSNMVEGAAYVGSFLWATRGLPLWGPERGTGYLDGGAPWYDTYETQDGMYMAVGAIEPQFYAELIDGLGLSQDDYPQFGDFPKLKDVFTKIFKSKTQKEWSVIFEDRDACVTPVVPHDKAAEHRHNSARKAFIQDPDGGVSPNPAPTLSRTPAQGCPRDVIQPGQHTRQVLMEFGYKKDDIDQLKDGGAIDDNPVNSKL